MSLNIEEYIDREIANYCKYHWPDSESANSTPFNLVDFRNCYIMQLIKDAYYAKEPKSSLRFHRGTDDDSARMQDSRNIAYAQHYRKLQYQHLLETTGIPIQELLPEKVKTRNEKLHGHEKTAMQYFELNTMMQHPLLKAIINKRICNVKKISIPTFKEYMKDYDELTNNLVKGFEGNDEEVVFSAIALYTLEWKFAIEFFYSCAESAERIGVTIIPQSKINQLCTHHARLLLPESTTILNTESRFILHRMDLIAAVYDDSFPWSMVDKKLYHYLVMKYYFNRLLIHHDSLVEYYGMTSTKKEWADFIRKSYDLRSIYKEKEWTNKRIRYVRQLFDLMIIETPTP